MMQFLGHCRCRAVSYAFEAAAFPSSYACHCLDCQTMSGSALTIQIPLNENRLKLQGHRVHWEHKDSKGNLTTQSFCALCMTRLYGINSGRPGVALLRGGTLDHSNQIIPKLHIWVKRKQPWIEFASDAEAYQEWAPIDRMQSAFSANFS